MERVEDRNADKYGENGSGGGRGSEMRDTEWETERRRRRGREGGRGMLHFSDNTD